MQLETFPVEFCDPDSTIISEYTSRPEPPSPGFPLEQLHCYKLAGRARVILLVVMRWLKTCGAGYSPSLDWFRWCHAPILQFYATWAPFSIFVRLDHLDVLDLCVGLEHMEGEDWHTFWGSWKSFPGPYDEFTSLHFIYFFRFNLKENFVIDLSIRWVFWRS